MPDDAPLQVTAVALGRTLVHISWDLPLFPNGNITSYTLYVSPYGSVTLGGGVMSHDLDGLLPYTNYTITVSASTSVGEGPAGPEGGVVITTHQDGE